MRLRQLVLLMHNEDGVQEWLAALTSAIQGCCPIYEDLHIHLPDFGFVA